MCIPFKQLFLKRQDREESSVQCHHISSCHLPECLLLAEWSADAMGSQQGKEAKPVRSHRLRKRMYIANYRETSWSAAFV